MIKLVGIAGSLRQGSYNRALLRAASEVMPPDSQLQILSIDEVPLYNADNESELGIPEPVAALKDAIEAAAGVVLVTPEYNGGMPGVLKNAIDWISRPPQDIPRVLRGKPVALMGATPGGFGTAFSQVGWLHVLRTLRMELWVEQGPFYLSRAGDSFDESGLKDADQRDRLRSYLAAFVSQVSG
jgi:NAD(P)H-dependent FMN reductase